METFYQAFLLYLLGANLASVHCTDEPAALTRERRNSLQLCDMINIYTQRPCLLYGAYGCFCGFRSWGNSPVDSSDSCCRQHDQCFASLGCSKLVLLTYSYSCSNRYCTCTDSNLSSCQYRSCQCDVQLAQCLKQATYSGRYRFHSRRHCH